MLMPNKPHATMIDAPEGFYGRRGGGRVGLLAPTIVAEVDRRYRTRAVAEERGVVGALYTGPPAIQLSLGNGRLFGRVAVQSPFAIDAMLPMYQRQIDAASDAPRPEAFYFEWAHWDMRSRLEGLVLKDYMRDLYDLFVAAGYEYRGGGDAKLWALAPPDGSQSGGRLVRLNEPSDDARPDPPKLQARWNGRIADLYTSIRRTLDENGWNREETARRLGMSRTTLWRKMREYGLLRRRA